MSRSFKKHPYLIDRVPHGQFYAQRKVRRIGYDIGNYSAYKKLKNKYCGWGVFEFKWDDKVRKPKDFANKDEYRQWYKAYRMK